MCVCLIYIKISYQFFNKILDKFDSKSLEPYCSDAFLFVLSESIGAKHTCYGLVGVYV